MADDDFEPKLGRIGSTRERSYLQRVLQSAAREGARHARTGRRFSGSRIGRGAGIGRVLGSRDTLAAFRTRRVIVQARIVKLVGKGLANARAHLRYIQRDGVTREGAPGELFDRNQDKANGKEFIDRADGDRHQFRFIVSPEDAEQYQDLKPFVRRLMARMEKDLDTRLDWVAANHYNTGHPHAHIIVRGKDETGKDLIIAREYITHGMRERAAEIVSLDFGPRSDFEVLAKFQNEVGQERFTSIDRDLLRTADQDRMVAAVAKRAFDQTVRAGRLQKLGRLGLAIEIAPGRWQLDANLRETLRQMGERGDIIKTMHRELAREKVVRSVADYAIYDPGDRVAGKLVGRVVGQGLSDELHDRRYLIVDGVDGRTHYVEIGLTDPLSLPPDGGIVGIDPLKASLRPSDRVVAEIAAAHDGAYSATLHTLDDPSASPEFVLSHIRRLEALRRAGMAVERQTDGTWTIPPDHLAQVERHEQAQLRLRPVQVEMLSPVGLERQVGVIGATWLDRELIHGSVAVLRDAGFGYDVQEALDRRRRWLVAQGFAQELDGRAVFAAVMVGELQRRELAKEGTRLARERGLPYAHTERGDHVDGIYKRRVDLASGRFAVIENCRELTLVPWRPVIEQSLGREVSGIMRGDTISWSIGRQRSGPSI
ncbi:MAG TPA: relaxase/mobilization nuclease RlxS [Devosia sp.]|nr:relaxase/mobilization nuclease RlxS [Devosia sp.]